MSTIASFGAAVQAHFDMIRHTNYATRYFELLRATLQQSQLLKRIVSVPFNEKLHSKITQLMMGSLSDKMINDFATIRTSIRQSFYVLYQPYVKLGNLSKR